MVLDRTSHNISTIKFQGRTRRFSGRVVNNLPVIGWQQPVFLFANSSYSPPGTFQHAAWLTIVGQYAKQDKWRALIKTAEDMIHNRRWKGSSTFSLETFIAQHCSAYVSLSQCAEHVPYELPNEVSRVTYLLDNIESMDPPLQAAMALVQNGNSPSGKMNDFEATASFILPHHPVAKKRLQASNPNKRPTAEISDTTAPFLLCKVGLAFLVIKNSGKLTDERSMNCEEVKLPAVVLKVILAFVYVSQPLGRQVVIAS